MDLLTGNFEQRLRSAISFSWEVFSKKVGSGLITVNKEASMQLHYASILQQTLSLVSLEAEETVRLELETGIKVEGRSREIDLLIVGKKGSSIHKFAIEVKCYRKIAASGGSRGATDIFMKDVYEDLHLLERYCEEHKTDKGISLVMNDRTGFIFPKNKNAKCWDYDISEGAVAGPATITTQVGDTKKSIKIVLKKCYTFNWKQNGGFWFSEIEGIKASATASSQI